MAGPEVFLPDAARVGEAKKAICRQYGFEGLFPGDDAIPSEHLRPEAVHLAFASLVEMMTRSDLIVANLTPFRGASVDVGTAMEIGFMHALGRPVFAYTNDARSYAERVGADDPAVGPEGMTIEPFGLADNLMCIGPVLQWGSLVVSAGVAEHERFTDLGGFEGCVRQARQRLAG